MSSYRALGATDWNPLWRSAGEGDPLGRDRRVRRDEAPAPAVEVIELRNEHGNPVVTLVTRAT